MSRFQIFLCTLVFFLFCIVLTGVPLAFASGVDAANAGMKALNQGDKKKAKILFQSALKSNELTKKNYIIVNNELCKLFWSESKMARAINCFSESLYIDPDDSQARFNRGTLYKDIGEYKRAIKDLSRYIVLSPRDDRGYIYRGLSYRALKETDRAISDLSQAIDLRPGKGEGYVFRGNTYFETGHYNLAMADLEKAVQLSPKSASVHQALAWFYAACPNGDFRHGVKAVEFAQKALDAEKSDKSRSMLLETLAAAHAESGNLQKAVHIQEQAMALVMEADDDWVVYRKEISRRLDLYKGGTPCRGIYTFGKSDRKLSRPMEKQTGNTTGSTNDLAEPVVF